MSSNRGDARIDYLANMILEINPKYNMPEARKLILSTKVGKMIAHNSDKYLYDQENSNLRDIIDELKKVQKDCNQYSEFTRENIRDAMLSVGSKSQIYKRCGMKLKPKTQYKHSLSRIRRETIQQSKRNIYSK